MIQAISGGGVSVYGGGTPSSSLHASGSAPVMGGGMDYVETATPEHGRCHHVKADGLLCGRFPKRGNEFCPAHNP